MPSFPIEKVIVDQAVRNLAATREILGRLRGVPIETTRTTHSAIEAINEARDPIRRGKRTLLLTRNEGPFLVSCPGRTKQYICCRYTVLRTTAQCPLDCTYCILQANLANRALTHFVNLKDLFHELDEVLDPSPNRFFRMGNGEYADSLALEPTLRFLEKFIPYIVRKKNAVFELKTKTAQIQPLKAFRPDGKIVVAWSMTTDRLQREEERRSASIDERLRAARQCQKWGYRLAFHFDPLIHYPDWEKEYASVVERMLDAIDPEKVVWISLGALRFPPALKPLVQERFPKTRFFCGEMIRGWDGKYRYIQPIRLQLYSKMAEWIRRRASRPVLYLCMESPEIWQKALGENMTGERLSQKLDERCTNCKPR